MWEENSLCLLAGWWLLGKPLAPPTSYPTHALFHNFIFWGEQWVSGECVYECNASFKVLSSLFNFYFTDVSDIKYVINLDFPNNTEDYVHRIGRTARAKRTGTSYSFFTPSNAKQAKELIEILREAKQEINPKLFDMVQLAKQMSHGRGGYLVGVI